MKKDMFAHLIGKEIKAQNSEHMKGNQRMFVAAIDYDIGITIKHLEDGRFKCDLCLNKSTWANMALAGSYDEHFWSWITAIEGDIFSLDDYRKCFGNKNKSNRFSQGATVCGHSAT